MSSGTHIYALHDPTDLSRRIYVGKAIDPGRRLRAHCRPSTNKKGIRADWIRGLLARGVRPEMVVLEVVPACGDWQEAERFWIESLRAVGANLANHTLGGEGAPGYVHPPEVRAKMRAKAQGRGAGVPKSLEHIARLRSARLGLAAPGSLAALRRIADERRGKPMPWTRGARSESTRRAMSLAKAAAPARSKSGFKGVSPTRSGKYEASIWNGRCVRLGLFEKPEDAARAYDDAAFQKWGAAATLNFPRSITP